uniref:Uncharacterized protein n=1 Tax=Ditylenchus dipsaci TaxID=166011 RepID=A0A915DPY6_9BILA
MDDAFDSLGYDQEEDGLPLKTKDNTNAVKSQPNGLTSNPVPVLNAGQQASNQDELQWSPFDWHMNFDVEEQAAKRRKLEDIENSVATATMRILEARRRRKAQMSTSKPSNDANKQAVLPKVIKHLLKYPPVNGMHWFGSALSTVLLEKEQRLMPDRRPSRRNRMLDESEMLEQMGGDASELLDCTADETMTRLLLNNNHKPDSQLQIHQLAPRHFGLITKQAGYRPFLINVSEITSIAEFRAKIEDVSGLGAIDLMFSKSNQAKT